MLLGQWWISDTSRWEGVVCWLPAAGQSCVFIVVVGFLLLFSLFAVVYFDSLTY